MVLEPTLDRMDCLLAEWEREADRRAVFLDCYARMTRAMGRHLDHGAFADPTWVADLLGRFADHYFDAHEAWERRDPLTPRPWVVAFEATSTRRCTPAQLLLAGVNAHINYDLVLTLVALLEADWPNMPDDERAQRRADYDLVNDVIAATIDEVQDHVLERHMPWTAALDVGMGRVDEWLAFRLLRSWRTDVWRHTLRVLDDAPTNRPGHLDRRALQCERRARWILLRG